VAAIPNKKKGAPHGNKNRFKTGRHSKAYRALRHDLTVLKRNVRLALIIAEATARTQEPA
jgi:hypothetical protein